MSLLRPASVCFMLDISCFQATNSLNIAQEEAKYIGQAVEQRHVTALFLISC